MSVNSIIVMYQDFCFTEAHSLSTEQATVAKKNSYLTKSTLERDQAHMGNPPADGHLGQGGGGGGEKEDNTHTHIHRENL